MIRKPAGDWGRESAAVATARTVATTGAAAVKTGVRTMRGVVLCALGVILLLGALGSLATGSVGGLIGGGCISAVLIVFGVRLIRGPQAKAEAGLAPAFAGGGTAVDYSRRKLVNFCLFVAVALAAVLWGAANLHGAKQFVSMILIPLFGMMLLLAVRKAMGDLTALRWDGHGLTVAGLGRSRTAPWSQVASIGLEQVNTYAYFFVKVGSATSLTVRFTDGGPRKLSVSAKLLDLQERTLEGLVLTLQAAQMGRAAAAPQPRPQTSAPGFGAAPPQRAPRPAPAAAPVDADAAIARYMAEQARAQPQTPPPQAEPAAYYAGLAPARATFGRRGA